MDDNASIGVGGRGVRRVVTGHDDHGRSRVLTDEVLPLQGPPGHNQGAAALWATQGAPRNDGAAAPELTAFPGPGGTSWMVIQIPPESDLDTMSPENRAIAMASPADHVPGLFRADTSRHFGMHYSETVDLGVVLSGELTMLLDDGEVTLRAGDTLVQRGTAHAWSNRSSEPALMAVVILGAEPLTDRRNVDVADPA
jgi:mannose-6-phosphate isomerase-like protein (cupin superfamily)